MIEPKKCRHNPAILCGVVKNINNCSYPTEDMCKASNVENWLGMVNDRFESLTLKRFRYSVRRIKLSVLDKNMCSECRIIWAEPQDNCPICKGDD